MKILEVTNLCKTYGKGDTMVKALDNVSFSVEKGEFLAIIGPSGSGKSTLLHILGGVDVPTSGSVVINQTDISNLDEAALAIFRRRQIGLIYQFYNLIPILTVQENLTLPLLLDGRKPEAKVYDSAGMTLDDVKLLGQDPAVGASALQQAAKALETALRERDAGLEAFFARFADELRQVIDGIARGFGIGEHGPR